MLKYRAVAPSRTWVYYRQRRRARYTKPLPFGFPASVAGDSRTILDQFGTPWLAIGDTPASAIAQLTNAEQDQYLTDRGTKGFRAIWIQTPEHHFSDSAPNDILGNAAFTGTAYQSALNEAYWLRVDRFVRKAETLGITCLMFVSYLGFAGSDEGWDDEMSAASNAQVAAVGTALGNRYKNQRNIMWVAGGDTNGDATKKDRVDNMMAAIHAVAPQLITGHQLRGSTADSVWGAYSWLTVNSTYTDGTLVTDLETGYADTPTRPVIFIEGRAEYETSYTAPLGRKQLWSPMVEGHVASLMINNPMWFFNSTTGAGFGTPPGAYDTWQEALDSPLSLDAQRLATFVGTYTPANWRLLTPGVPLVTTGEGTTTAKAGVGADTANGRAVVYFPTSRSITLDLSVFTPAALHLDWFDPTNGTTTSIGSYANTSGRTVTYPSANSAGDNDWVLVINPSNDQIRTGALNGTGTFSATVAITRTRTSTLPCTGVISATQLRTYPRTATLAGTGAFAATTAVTRSRTSTLPGTATFSAQSARTLPRTSSLTGTGSLTAAVVRTLSRSSGLTGAGSFTGAAFKTLMRSASLVATGTFSATLPGVTARTCTLSGAGAFAATVSITRTRSGSLTGAGVLTGTRSFVVGRTAALAGQSTFIGAPAKTCGRAATLAGHGSFSALIGNTGPVITGPLTLISLDVARTLVSLDTPRTLEAL